MILLQNDGFFSVKIVATPTQQGTMRTYPQTSNLSRMLVDNKIADLPRKETFKFWDLMRGLMVLFIGMHILCQTVTANISCVFVTSAVCETTSYLRDTVLGKATSMVPRQRNRFTITNCSGEQRNRPRSIPIDLVTKPRLRWLMPQYVRLNIEAGSTWLPFSGDFVRCIVCHSSLLQLIICQNRFSWWSGIRQTTSYYLSQCLPSL